MSELRNTSTKSLFLLNTFKTLSIFISKVTLSNNKNDDPSLQFSKKAPRKNCKRPKKRRMRPNSTSLRSSMNSTKSGRLLAT